MDLAQKEMRTFDTLRWSLIVVFFIFTALLIVIFHDPELLILDAFVVTGLIFIIVLLSSLVRYGKKNTAVFFLIIAAVSVFFENISMVTGFPFGLYHYSPVLGPLRVPLIIILEYFALGYISWMIAQVLTGQYGRKIEGKQVIVIPLIATFVFVMWDLTVDPIASTVHGFWVWQNPGVYFGVPLSNFFGWFLVGFIFFQIFSWYISRYDLKIPEKSAELMHKPFWSEAPAVYGFTALCMVALIFYQDTDFTVSMALVTVFTMGFVTILAFVDIMDNPELE